MNGAGLAHPAWARPAWGPDFAAVMPIAGLQASRAHETKPNECGVKQLAGLGSCLLQDVQGGLCVPACIRNHAPLQMSAVRWLVLVKLIL